MDYMHCGKRSMKGDAPASESRNMDWFSAYATLVGARSWLASGVACSMLAKCAAWPPSCQQRHQRRLARAHLALMSSANPEALVPYRTYIGAGQSLSSACSTLVT